MTALLLVATALLQVVCGHGFDYGHGYGYGHAYGYGHGYGYGLHAHALPLAHPAVYPAMPHAHHEDDEDDKVILTCKAEGANSLSINIKNRKYSHLLSHIGYDKMPGLEATVNLQLDTDNEQVAIVFTKLSREDCNVNGMKDLVYPKGFNYYMHHVYGFHHHAQHSHVVPGVITEGNFGTDRKQVFVDRLAGFTSLAELAGRGVQVCLQEYLQEDSDGKYICEEPNKNSISTGLACCALEYADQERNLA